MGTRKSLRIRAGPEAKLLFPIHPHSRLACGDKLAKRRS